MWLVPVIFVICPSFRVSSFPRTLANIRGFALAFLKHVIGRSFFLFSAFHEENASFGGE